MYEHELSCVPCIEQNDWYEIQAFFCLFGNIIDVHVDCLFIFYFIQFVIRFSFYFIVFLNISSGLDGAK